VVLNAESVWEALTYHEAPRHVIKDGKEVTGFKKKPSEVQGRSVHRYCLKLEG